MIRLQPLRTFGVAVKMKTTVRSSKSPSKADTGSKQSTMPTSSIGGHGSSVPLSYLSNRDFGRYSVRGTATGSVNFLQKNRLACSRNGTGNPAGGCSPPRIGKIGQAPMIGDALGTPSNKGSSSFMSAGHNGVRDPNLKDGFKKRDTFF